MIKVEGLTRKYGGFTAVDDVSFVCQPGTVTGFLGPNGAGKTTTMRVMVGLTPATRGRVTIGGHLYHDIPNPGRHVGVLLDASAQHAGRTGREILTIGAQTMGLPASRVDEMLDAGLARRDRGQAPAAQLLARHEAAARHRPRAARRPVGADPRRAGQRPRPGRHPLDARPAQGVRRPRRHRAALQPPAQRGRADRRRDDPDRPRQDRRPAAPRTSCSPDRDRGIKTSLVTALDNELLTKALHGEGLHRHAGRRRPARRPPSRSRSAGSPPSRRSSSPTCAPADGGLEDLFLELTDDTQREHGPRARALAGAPHDAAGHRSTSRRPPGSRSPGWSRSSSASWPTPGPAAGC